MRKRPILQETEDLLQRIRNFRLSDPCNNTYNKMDATTLQTLLNIAVQQAIERTRQNFKSAIGNLTRRINVLEPPSNKVTYEEITITPGVECNEPLDIVKSVPEFKGESEKYVS